LDYSSPGIKAAVLFLYLQAEKNFITRVFFFVLRKKMVKMVILGFLE